MAIFNEDTRVKIPAIIQFMRLGYSYQSLKDAVIDPDTKILINRFKPAIERINNKKLTDKEVGSIIRSINSTVKQNDLGKSFYNWLVYPQKKIKIIDFDNINNNDIAVVAELPFGEDAKNSFRPDISIFVNGIPLGFLEVKRPNNTGGIQAEFDRMLNKRLKVPEYKKFFNMFQILGFSNNMEYESNDTNTIIDGVRAGSFYATPNGCNTTFSIFREQKPKKSGFTDVSWDLIKYVLEDNHYSSLELETPEFQTNLDINSPCNRFITSLFDKKRLFFFLQYGIVYIGGRVPQKHIMRYHQYFAAQGIINRLENNGKSGLIFHAQGSGKTALSAFIVRILNDYFAKKNLVARIYYVVDRIDLLMQASDEMRKRGLNPINVINKAEFEKELNRPLAKNLSMDSTGEVTVVNIQKFSHEIPAAENDYKAKIQRVFFVDEAHRSYSNEGEFFGNLMRVDKNAIYFGMTATPIISDEERSTTKFGPYVHAYSCEEAIADGCTLRIKREEINAAVKTKLRRNLGIDAPKIDTHLIMESDSYINTLCKFIDEDFITFRTIHSDNSLGGMIVCCSNPQAKKIKKWFDDNSNLRTGLVISGDISSEENKKTQIAFKETLDVDILIVHQMLTTGYDVARLKKMYLLRLAKKHTLLQTISRVNRPYKSPEGKVYRYGYITDFAGIGKEYKKIMSDYLNELKQGSDYETSDLEDVVIKASDINAKYLNLQTELDKMIDTSNLELFSRALVSLSRDELLTVRRYLNDIKACQIEFLISREDEYAEQIDTEHIKKLVSEVQHRIDFLNLKDTPTNLMSIISNKEIVEIVYKLFKTKISILDSSFCIDKTDKSAVSDRCQLTAEMVVKIQNELKKNKDLEQDEIVKLDEILKTTFEMLEIADLSSIDNINAGLEDILKAAHETNEMNEKFAAKYNNSYVFVKTCVDAVKAHPDYDKDDVSSVIDIVYSAVKNCADPNILIIQSRDSFIANIKKATTAPLIKSGLYSKLNMKGWYTSLLNETYTNIQTF